MTKRKLIDRNFGDRLTDLRTSLLVIRDALETIKSGKFHFIIPIFGQLRALLIEKRRDNAPLLIDLAQRLSTEPSIYWMRGSPEALMEATGLDSPELYFSGFPMGLRKELPAQEAIMINELLEEKIVFFKDSSFSLGNLIKICAEKAGGAHWAKRLTEQEQSLLAINLGGIQPAHQALIQFAKVVLEFGNFLLSKLTTQHIHLFALIPNKEIQHPTALLSYGYPNGANNISLIIGKRRALVAEIKTFKDGIIRLNCSPELSSCRLHHFEIAHELDNLLHSVLSMRVDGKLCGEVRVPFPVLYDGRGHQIEGRINVPLDESVEDGIEFGLAELILRGEATEDYARERLEAYFRAKDFEPEQKLVLVLPKCHGYKPIQNRHIQFDEPARMSTVRSYLESIDNEC